MSIVVNKTRLPATNWQTKSGAIVSIDDARQRLARSLKVHMNPIQDLHGYDNPWPAGGGVNKWNNSALTIGYWCGSDGTITSAQYGAISDAISINGQTAFSIKHYGERPYSYAILEYASDDTFIKRTLYAGDDGTHVTLDESTAYIKVQIACTTSVPLTNSMIESYQMMLSYGNSYPATYSPYSNICPISGRSEVDVSRTGKNLLEPKFYSGFQYNPNVGSSVVGQGGVVDVTDSVTKNGDTYTKSGASWSVPMSMILYVNRQFWGKTVKFSGTVDHISGYRSAYYLVDSNNILLAKSASMNENPTWTIAIPENTAYIVWYLNTSSAGTMKITEPMIELGSIATSYEPYQGNTYTIALGQTVYGGTLDVTSGVLTVNTIFGSKILSDSDFEAVSSGTNTKHYRYYGAFLASQIQNTNKAICNVAPYAYNSNDAPHFYPTWNSSQQQSRLEIWLPHDTPTSTEIQVCAELATPITYQLTPTEVEMLVRDNTIWSDADSVEVEYAAVHQHG